jgi:RNA polymerase sigma-70 factor (ECF subfamily)
MHHEGRNNAATCAEDSVVKDDFATVLRACQAGDQVALAELWQRFNFRLVRFLWARVGDDADDVASETWIGVAQGLPTFEGNEAEFRAWLFTIARRRVVDRTRRAAARPKLVSEPPTTDAVVAHDDPADAALERLGTRAALQLVARLPDEQAEVILLRVVAGLDTARVAQIVGTRPGNVRVLQHRGLLRLRELLDAPAGVHRGVTR